MAAAIGRAIFRFPVWLAYALGFVCALDPLQLVWKRYVMTETLSLLFYVLVLYSSFLYLRERRDAVTTGGGELYFGTAFAKFHRLADDFGASSPVQAQLSPVDAGHKTFGGRVRVKSDLR